MQTDRPVSKVITKWHLRILLARRMCPNAVVASALQTAVTGHKCLMMLRTVISKGTQKDRCPHIRRCSLRITMAAIKENPIHLIGRPAFQLSPDPLHDRKACYSYCCRNVQHQALRMQGTVVLSWSTSTFNL